MATKAKAVGTTSNRVKDVIGTPLPSQNVTITAPKLCFDRVGNRWHCALRAACVWREGSQHDAREAGRRLDGIKGKEA